MDYFSWDQVADFYTRLAQVTPYWDFSYSSVSFEPRYFYDETHFRNCVGEMALARMFGDSSVYVPEDFGEYVSQSRRRAGGFPCRRRSLQRPGSNFDVP